jgi:hypothetical protein
VNNKQTTNKQSETTPSDVTPLMQIKVDLEVEIAALKQQIADTTTELETKRQQLDEARVAVAKKIVAAQRQIEADQIEKKIGEFVAVAARLDHAQTVADMASFKKLAAELCMAKRVKQAHHARESLISRMLGQSVHKPPFPNWSALAQPWLIPTPAKVA